MAPPDFAPQTSSLITLYDVAVEVARTSGTLPTPPEVSFTRDIYPLLARPVGLAWVNEVARARHGDPRRNFLTPARLARLSSNSAADAPVPPGRLPEVAHAWDDGRQPGRPGVHAHPRR